VAYPSTIGRYTVTRTLSSDSFVFEVVNDDGQVCALKLWIVSPTAENEDTERFEREATALTRLSGHENIISLIEILRNSECLLPNGLAFYAGSTKHALVMELGLQSVEQLVYENGVVSEPTARAIFRSALSAVTHCHQHGITHRDLNCSQLLITCGSDLKI
jgi:serine/threonine protein kinase